MSTPRITVVICTFNRATYARKAIKSLLVQTLPDSDYEILLVDNNSTDDTRAMAESFADSRVRYCFEHQQGLSVARNTGFREARAEIVAYLDDDGIATPEWLAAVLEIFSSETRRPGAVGGPIKLDWELPEPDWVSAPLYGELGALDWGSEKRVIKTGEWLCGGNLALCRKALFEVGGFPVSLGRTGNRQATFEETFVIDQFQAMGLPCWYQPQMLMYHTVLVERICQRWFRERFYGKGRSWAHKELLEHPVPYRKRCRKAWVGVMELLRYKGYFRALLTRSRTPEQFHRKVQALFSVGYIMRNLGF